MLLVFRHTGKWMCPACLIRVKWRISNVALVHALCTDAPWLHGSFTGLKRLFTPWKRLFTAWKYYLRLENDYLWIWSNFCRIVSLFLITWHTFNQSLNKNIWMTYIMCSILLWGFVCWPRNRALRHPTFAPWAPSIGWIRVPIYWEFGHGGSSNFCPWRHFVSKLDTSHLCFLSTVV